MKFRTYNYSTHQYDEWVSVDVLKEIKNIASTFKDDIPEEFKVKILKVIDEALNDTSHQ